VKESIIELIEKLRFQIESAEIILQELKSDFKNLEEILKSEIND